MSFSPFSSLPPRSLHPLPVSTRLSLALPLLCLFLSPSLSINTFTAYLRLFPLLQHTMFAIVGENLTLRLRELTFASLLKQVTILGRVMTETGHVVPSRRTGRSREVTMRSSKT